MWVYMHIHAFGFEVLIIVLPILMIILDFDIHRAARTLTCCLDQSFVDFMHAYELGIASLTFKQCPQTIIGMSSTL